MWPKFLFVVVMLGNSVQSFDLISSLLSQPGQGGPGQIPELKRMVTPEVLRKMMQAEQEAGHPASGTDRERIQRLLSKLKPQENRLDPAVLDLLTRQRVHPEKNITPQPRPMIITRPPVYRDEGVLPTTTAKFIPSSPSNKKYSSKFRLNNKASRSSTSEPLNHISDPNIRNHRLYENYENFTIIDNVEDLMAEESMDTEVSSISPWLPARPVPPPRRKNRLVMDSSIEGQLREPLIKSSTERNLNYLQGEEGDDDEENFRPSQLDPHYFTPDQDFYTTTLRYKNKGKSHGKKKRRKNSDQENRKNKKPRVQEDKQGDNEMSNFPPSYYKTERILNTEPSQMSHSVYIPHEMGNFRQPFPHLQQMSNYRKPTEYNNGRPTEGGNFFSNFIQPLLSKSGLGSLTRNEYQNDDNNYEDVGPGHSYYSSGPHHHSSVHHDQIYDGNNYYHGVASNEDGDSPWKSSLLILGGLVVLTALIAFVLPTFLTSFAGKETEKNDVEGFDFWTEVKGLYSDLSSIVRGDTNYNRRTSAGKISFHDHYDSSSETRDVGVTPKVNGSDWAKVPLIGTH